MKRYSFLILLLIILSAVSCSDDTLDQPALVETSIKRTNPFSVETMERAKESIKGSSIYAAAGSPHLNPRVTHLYVAFSPANEEELTLLAKDAAVALFEEPLDISFLGEDEALFDYSLSDLPDDSPGHRFTTVEKDYMFPDVAYSIISELYLPFEDPLLFKQEDTRGTASSDADCEAYLLAQQWENEALNLAGLGAHVEVPLDCEPPQVATSGSYPSHQWGRILIHDNTPGVDGPIPIEGVRVTTTRFLSWKRSHTNSEGYYKVNSPHHNKNSQYHIKWEDDDFRIIAHSGGQAKLQGPKQSSPWNFTIANNTKAQWYGTAFSAAKQYYDGERYGLAKPENGNLLRTTIKVRENDCTSRYAPHADISVVGAIFFNDVKVCVDQRRIDNVSRIYGITIHELTHSAHFKARPGNFSEEILLRPKGRRVLESWAQGVEWWFTVNKYRRLTGVNDWSYDGNYQTRTVEGSPIYTSVVIDLMDNFNQRAAYGGSLIYPNDMVSGYTINQIEDALYRNGGVSLFSNWKHNLDNMFNNPTSPNLNVLFASWD